MSPLHRCARICAAEHLGQLRAFTVTGTHVSPPPPAPQAPPRPARPPISPSGIFNGCANACAHTASLSACHDGGHGSFYPQLCDYGSQVRAHPAGAARSAQPVRVRAKFFFEGDKKFFDLSNFSYT